MQTRPPSSENEMFRFHNFLMKEMKKCAWFLSKRGLYRLLMSLENVREFVSQEGSLEIVSQEGSAKSSHVRTQLDGDALPHSI